MKMRLLPLKLGKCTVEISSSNGKKPKARVERDKLLVEPICVCGQELGTFEIDDHTSTIIENALIQKRIAEEHGKRIIIEMDDFSSIDADCPKCGREIHVTIHHVLDKAWLNELNYKRAHGKESLHYGDCLHVTVELEGAHFRETRSPRLLRELLRPICACGMELSPNELITATESMINDINRFWEEGGEVKPKTVKIKEKCPFCLHDVKITAKLTPLLPKEGDSVQKIVERYKSWKTRQLT